MMSSPGPRGSLRWASSPCTRFGLLGAGLDPNRVEDPECLFPGSGPAEVDVRVEAAAVVAEVEEPSTAVEWGATGAPLRLAVERESPRTRREVS